MQLLIIVEKNPFFQNSASANRWQTLIEGLTQLEAEILLIITNGYSTKVEWNRLGTSGQIKGIEYKYLSKFLHNKLWKKRWHRYFESFFHNIKIKRKVQKLIKRNPNALIWTSATLLGFQIAYKTKKRNPERKIIVEMNEFLDIHNYNSSKIWQRLAGDKKQKYFEKKALYCYDGLALMTKTLIDHYKKFQGRLPFMLHLPMTVDLNRFQGNIKPINNFKQPYIVFIGFMNDRKEGVNVLIEAFSKIASNFNDLKLYLVGPKTYDTPNHYKLINKLQLTDRVFIMGEYHRDKIPSILKNAELLVLPRPESKQAQGGFPTKLGEYLATGRPICATKVGEIPLYLEDEASVYFAKPGSVDSFSDAMKRALSNPDKAYKIGLKGKEIAMQNFNKKIQANILYEFMKSL